jgi:exonuclease III
VRGKREEVNWLGATLKADIVCLQETLLPPHGWQLNSADFSHFHHPVNDLGGRGLYIGVEKSTPAHELFRDSPGHILAVKIFPAWSPSGLIVVNVYVKSGFRESTLRHLVHLLRRHASVPCAIIGDWNMPVEKGVRLLEAGAGTALFRPVGRLGATFRRQQRYRTAIDYGLYNPSAAALGAWTDARFPDILISDHCPISLDLQTLGNGAPQVTSKNPVYATKDWAQKRAPVSTHNTWSELANLSEEDPDLPLSDIAARFREASDRVAREEGILRTRSSIHTRRRSAARQLPRALQRALRDHRRKTQRTLALGWNATSRTALRDLERAQKQLRQRIREHRRTTWNDLVFSKAQSLAASHGRVWWRWINTLRLTENSACPVRNDAGDLVLRAPEVALAWKEHLERLYAGLPRSAQEWDQALGDLRVEPPIPGISDPFSWPEVRSALAHVKVGKAPGVDLIPAEFLKLCAEPPSKPSSTDGPPNPMAQALLNVLNALLTHGPTDSLVERIVVMIPKKGDLTDRHNYRGIALLNSTAKLMTYLIGQRTITALEERVSLDRSQGGFRPDRETATQQVALFEIVQRHFARGHRRLYLLFVDIEKAFDRVPHEGLFRKLEGKGVTGKALTYIRAMYSKAQCRVRVGKHLGETRFNQETGVHQGCPFSPTAFAIYIDDILRGMGTLGVQVDTDLESIIGLLFADDLVLLARSTSILRKMLEHLADWGAKAQLSFGVKRDGSKTAILPLGKGAKSRVQKAGLELTGQAIPIVDHYKYLGITFRDNLSLRDIALDARDRSQNALNRVSHFLSDRAFPLATKLLILRTVVLGTAMYSAELWGGVQAHVRPIQSVINKGLKLCFGYKTTASPPLDALMIEADIPPVHCLATVARLRFYLKHKPPSFDSWLRYLIAHPPSPGARRGSWVRQTELLWQRTLRKFGSEKLLDESGHLASDNLRNELWHAQLKPTKALAELQAVRSYWAKPAWKPVSEWLRLWAKCGGSHRSEQDYLRFRLGTFWTCYRAALAGMLPALAQSVCPLCKAQTPETADHLLFACKLWCRERSDMMSKAQRIFSDIDWETLDDSERRRVLLGAEPSGAIRTLRDWRSLSRERAWIRAREPVWAFLNQIRVPRQAAVSNLYRSYGRLRTADQSPRAEAVTTVGPASNTASDAAGVG